MEPASLPSEGEPARAVTTKYQERYGGFRDFKAWGMLQWQLASFVKEMETLSTRRAEVAKKPSGTAPEAPPKAPGLSRKQQRAKLWAERKAAAAQPKA